MTHAEKLRCMAQHLGALGIPRSSFAPPVYRALWRMGIELPPPLFTPIAPLALAMGLPFAMVWAVLTYVSLYAVHVFMPAAVLTAPIRFIAVAALGAGAVFGVVMAASIRRRARKLDLPPWSRYQGRSAQDMVATH